MSAPLRIVAFTDPYCSWCWATEPSLIALRERYRDQLDVTFVMGGLIEDFAEFYDATNDIGTPAETLPHWRMVSERSGQPIDENFWAEITDPHFSTWPANIAVKAAEFQSPELAEKYLRRLRIGVETAREHISDRDVQLRLAGDVEGLDVAALEAELDGERATKAFKADRALSAAYGVQGFPAMLIVGGPTDEDEQQKGYLVPGHRSTETYESIIAQTGAELVSHEPRDIATLISEYGPLTTRELAEVYSTSVEDVAQRYGADVAQGVLSVEELRGGQMWDLVK